MVLCIKYLVGKNNNLFQFEYWQKKKMRCVSISYVYSKEEVCLKMNETILKLPPK